MEVRSGYFFITDITGYTFFLAKSELGHAKEILDTLFDTMLEIISPPLNILATQGDAIISYAPDSAFKQPQTLLEVIDDLYIGFHKQLELMVLNTTCTCNACANMSGLDLKIFLHHGEYIEQDISGTTELQGADVILIHRLMKNSVKEKFGLVGYALITEAAIQAMDVDDLTHEYHTHTETLEHFGEVNMRIADLAKVWQEYKERKENRLKPENAWAMATGEVPVSPWVAWDVATTPEIKRQYYGMNAIARTDDNGGRIGVGASFHCQHDMGDLEYVMIDWEPPLSYTGDSVAFGVRLWYTCEIVPIETGARVHFMYGPPEDPDPEIQVLFAQGAEAAMQRYIEMINAALEAGEIERYDPSKLDDLKRNTPLDLHPHHD